MMHLPALMLIELVNTNIFGRVDIVVGGKHSRRRTGHIHQCRREQTLRPDTRSEVRAIKVIEGDKDLIDLIAMDTQILDDLLVGIILGFAK